MVIALAGTVSTLAANVTNTSLLWMEKSVRLDKWHARRNAKIRAPKEASVIHNLIPGNLSAPPVNASKSCKC
ncbi:unnamed protein product [Caenorhabditis brenneri]